MAAEFFIFCLWLVYVVSKIFHKKYWESHNSASFPTTQSYFGVNFVHMCCHSNELCVTKTDIN